MSVTAIENTDSTLLETPQERTYREKMYYAAGAILLAAAATAAAGAALPAAGLAAVSAGVAYKGYATFDIDNPADLQILKNEAKSLTLNEVVEKHGWEKIEKYQILTDLEIEEKFKTETRHLTGTEVLSLFSYQTFDKFAEKGMFTQVQLDTIQQTKGELYRFANFIERQMALLERTYQTELRVIETERRSEDAKPAMHYDQRRERLMCDVERQLIALEKERMDYEHRVNQIYTEIKRGD